MGDLDFPDYSALGVNPVPVDDEVNTVPLIDLGVIRDVTELADLLADGVAERQGTAGFAYRQGAVVSLEGTIDFEGLEPGDLVLTMPEGFEPTHDVHVVGFTIEGMSPLDPTVLKINTDGEVRLVSGPTIGVTLAPIFYLDPYRGG